MKCISNFKEDLKDSISRFVLFNTAKLDENDSLDLIDLHFVPKENRFIFKQKMDKIIYQKILTQFLIIFQNTSDMFAFSPNLIEFGKIVICVQQNWIFSPKHRNLNSDRDSQRNLVNQSFSKFNKDMSAFVEKYNTIPEQFSKDEICLIIPQLEKVETELLLLNGVQMIESKIISQVFEKISKLFSFMNQIQIFVQGLNRILEFLSNKNLSESFYENCAIQIGKKLYQIHKTVLKNTMFDSEHEKLRARDSNSCKLIWE